MKRQNSLLILSIIAGVTVLFLAERGSASQVLTSSDMSMLIGGCPGRCATISCGDPPHPCSDGIALAAPCDEDTECTGESNVLQQVNNCGSSYPETNPACTMGPLRGCGYTYHCSCNYISEKCGGLQETNQEYHPCN